MSRASETKALTARRKVAVLVALAAEREGWPQGCDAVGRAQERDSKGVW